LEVYFFKVEIEYHRHLYPINYYYHKKEAWIKKAKFTKNKVSGVDTKR